MRDAMINTAFVASLGIVITTLMPNPAHATRCLYPGVTTVGQVRPQIQSARNAAMSSWEHAVARKFGRRYANWSYAGVGSVNCSWNKTGKKISCLANAVPCAE